MKAFFLIFLLATTAAFGRGAPPPPKPVEVVVLDPVVVQSPGKVEVVLNVTGTPAQIARLTSLKEVVKRVVNSPEFKTRILGAYYNGKPQFVSTTLSNAQVFEKLFVNWNLEIKFEKLGRNVLGRTLTNVNWFSFNTLNFDTREDSGLVGTICHEYSHKLGFHHSKYNNSARPYSLPYAVGTICAELYPLYK